MKSSNGSNSSATVWQDQTQPTPTLLRNTQESTERASLPIRTTRHLVDLFARSRTRLATGSILVYLVIVTILFRRILDANGGIFIYTLDDPYIHLTLARNLAHHATWGISPGIYASASSSPLWTLLLALPPWLGIDTSWAPLVFNIIINVIVLWIAWSLLGCEIEQAPHVSRVGLTLLLPVLLLLPTLTFMGMEQPLHLCLTLLLVGVVLRTWSEPDQPMPWRGLAALSLIMPITRYESLFALGSAALFLGWQRRSLHPIAVILGPATLSVGAYSVFNVVNGDAPLPNSILVKGFVSLITNNQPIAYRFLRTLLLYSTQNITLVGLTISLLVASRSSRSGWPYDAERRFAALWLAVLVTTHILFISPAWRYQVYLIAMAVVLLLRHTPRGLWNDMVIGASLLLLFFPLIEFQILTPEASHEIYSQQYQMARFLTQELPEAPVALNDIGAVSYFGQNPILDLVGLGTSDVTRLRLAKQYDTEAMSRLIREHSIEVIIVYDIWFPDRPDTWIPVARWHTADRRFGPRYDRPALSVADTDVTFYAPSYDYAEKLQHALGQYEPSLPEHVEVTYYDMRTTARRGGRGKSPR